MRYFVTLSGREFPLRLEHAAGAGPRLWTAGSPTASGADAAPERELGAELLRPARPGRAALVAVGGRLFRVQQEAAAALGASQRSKPRRVRINSQPLELTVETELERRARPAPSAARVSGTRVAAPMPGRVVKVNVRVGDSVVAGTPLLSVEAMKMENELQSPGAGRVLSVSVQVGATVESDQELIVISAE